MKIKRPVLASLIVIAALTITAIPGWAQQHIGFRIAIAPQLNQPAFQPTINPPLVIPGFSQPIVVPFGANVPTIVTAPFPASPFWFSPGQQFAVSQPRFHHHQGFGFQPGAVVIVSPPQTAFAPQVNTVVPVGTPRAHVIARFGQPSVTVITSTTETMHFNGGVTVIIQNGQVVAGPR
jgi:hypothetical protein